MEVIWPNDVIDMGPNMIELICKKKIPELELWLHLHRERLCEIIERMAMAVYKQERDLTRLQPC
jgi:hypothetical protein